MKPSSAILAMLLVGCAPTIVRTEADGAKLFLIKLTENVDDFITVPSVRECWVQRDDVSYLVSRLSSVERVPRVVLPLASSIRGPSTEREEAAFLIEGFRRGKYPPALRSEALSKEKELEIRKWWSDGGATPGSSCQGSR